MEKRWATLLVASLCASACGDPPPGETYFDREIKPILEGCLQNTSPCHKPADGDPFQITAGNLDVSSFEQIQKRRDTLTPFGVYPYPLLLIKAVGKGKLKFQYGNVPGSNPPVPRFLDIDVDHVGGAIIEPGSDAFFKLQTWLENGATANGLKPPTPAQDGGGACSTTIPSDFDRNAVVAMNPAAFDAFKQNVQPIFTDKGCAAGNCHGAPQSDFYITCGESDDQQAFNFSQAWSFVNNPVDDSQILRVPLAVAAGGRGHTGGDQFSGIDDEDYIALKTWAAGVGKLSFANGDPVKQFFEDHVQPVLLQRGCAFQACHSPQAGNDFKLRSGAVGFFSAVALEKNYHLLRDEFMALEFPDARRGRAVAKTITEDDLELDLATNDPVGGIVHRGGPVLETQGVPAADPAMCPQPYNPNAMPPPAAFCTLQEWIRLERAALGTEVTDMSSGQTAQIVYVQRTAPATAGRLEFDTFQGGADLRISDASYGAGGGISGADGGTSLLGGCGLGGSPDVQAPDVANDGNRIAFAARATASDPLGIYVVDVNGNNCTRITPAQPMSNGIHVHNFDPAWSPDGQWLVFASTRGKDGMPFRSRKRFLPQSDIWRIQVDGFAATGNAEQVTVLSNSEIGPQFMREGRITMTTEKASAGFYQLAGRRINWDLTDYHPLLGQRKDSLYVEPGDMTSTRPSIGYSSVTDIREGSDGNFLIILSNTATNGAPMTMGGAGALAIFNRSIGPFEADRFDVGFLRSVRVLDTEERYRGPVSLPDGRIMVARASSPTSGNFDIVMYNPRDNSVENLFGAPAIRVDAQLVYKHPPRKLYYNRRQLVFGGTNAGDDTAVVHMPHAPSLFTLLTGNLRRGRPVDAFSAARYLAVYEEGTCAPGACSANADGIFEDRTLLGRVSLEDDGSTIVELPARRGIVFELQDGSRNPIVTMGEEHQLASGERISMGVAEDLFDAICGGCHGSISGSELDVGVTPDALTGASRSASVGNSPATPSP